MTALSGLTLRGRCFLAAGAALAACAVVLGQRDLLRVAVLVLSLPAVAVAAVSRTRFLLRCTRHVEPAQVRAGSPATVTLTLHNVSRLPTGVLMLQDGIPAQLGPRPRFVLDRIEPQGSRVVTYSVSPQIRGRYSLGPLTVRLADPFGLVELHRSFAGEAVLVATPRVVPLPSTSLRGSWAGGGDGLARAVASAGDDDIVTREYRQGDDLRRVHWRSTARRGELMVRREEQPEQNRATVVLDTRAAAWPGRQALLSFEWGVEAAASIGVQLASSGFALRLLTARSEAVGHQSGTGPGDTSAGSHAMLALLDVLAEVAVEPTDALRSSVERLQATAGEGLIVGIFGLLSPADAAALSAVPTRGTTAVALLPDVSAWPGHFAATAAEQFSAAALLAAAGWHVVEFDPLAELRDIWREMASGRGAAPLARAGGRR
ncbi:MAG: DUF58 domain-containing protein [Actinomycetota bacterium]|nr:DUF58 domain-containing protein [Actinomycetota bacterium]